MLEDLNVHELFCYTNCCKFLAQLHNYQLPKEDGVPGAAVESPFKNLKHRHHATDL